MRQPAEFLFSLNVLNLCCHLWRQWQTSNTGPHPQHPSLTDEAMWPCGGKHILKFTPHTHTFFGCPLLLQYNIASHSLCASVSFVYSAGLINFYIRYTSLKMLHCFVLPLCVCVCVDYFCLQNDWAAQMLHEWGEKTSHLLVSMPSLALPNGL